MLTRRTLLKSALAATVLPLTGCAEEDYRRAAEATWNPVAPVTGADAPRALVHIATLAANSHNAQAWRFRIAGPQLIVAQVDPGRRLLAADPDDHHLWASLGCAIENLCVAAPAFGLSAEVEFGDDTTRVRLSPAPSARDALFDAIFQRQCTRSDYDGRALPAVTLRSLEAAATRPGVMPVMLLDGVRREQLLSYLTEANRSQVNNPLFVNELLAWLRFDGAEAARTRDGLYSACSGNPSLPRWLAQPVFRHSFTAERENDKLARQLRSSSGAIVLASQADRPAVWFEAGRAAQRFGLSATAAGLRYAYINQPVEVQAVRGQLASWLELGARRPSLVMRFGAAAPLPRSLRRPLAEVLV
jgi:hypothetical protein